MKRPFSALNLVALAILFAGSLTNAPAIMIRKLNGTALEVGYISGTVGHVEQKQHSFSLRWQGKGLTQMEHHYFSYEETYRITGGTVYKNGSWADMKNGIRVRITGHSDVADTVEFTTQIAAKVGAGDEHRETGNSLFNSTAEAQNAVSYFDRGFAKQKKGDLDGAMADYNQAVKLNPKDASAYNNRGNVKFTKGDLNGAMADYNLAIKSNPKYAAAYNNLGNVKLRKGDPNGALADLNQAIDLNPQYGLAYRNRGNAKRKKGDLDGAIADFNLAIKLGVTNE
jgi:tetratricopeptide (TPR) repeat protein